VSDQDEEEFESFDDRNDRAAPSVIEDIDDLDEDDDSDDSDEDDDSDDDDDDADDDSDDDDIEDAEPDEIDFVISAYREDGVSVVSALADDLANDLEELIVQLRRLPGDAGALGFVSLVGELFVLVRVRGQHVQVLLSDAAAADEWPIARDVAEFLGIDEVDEEDEGEPLGDLGILADLGVSDFDLGQIVGDIEASSDAMLLDVAEKIKIGAQFRRIVDAAFAN
jgi:putative tRNA adenosine deaminase-associated protein